MENGASSFTAVTQIPTLGGSLADRPAWSSAAALLVPRLFLSKMGREILWWVRTVGAELRSLAGRMRALHARRRGPDDSLSCGLLFERESSGRVVLSRSTLARIEGTVALLSKYQWASDADMMLVLEGWDLGSEYATAHIGPDR